jgi:hypothetical protein
MPLTLAGAAEAEGAAPGLSTADDGGAPRDRCGTRDAGMLDVTLDDRHAALRLKPIGANPAARVAARVSFPAW